MKGPGYWQYSMNHVGLLDTGAQLDFIDRIKRDEALTRSTDESNASSFSTSSSQSGYGRGHFSPLRASLLPFTPPLSKVSKSSSPATLFTGRWSSLFFKDASPASARQTEEESVHGLAKSCLASQGMHTSTSDSNLCDQDLPKSWKVGKAKGDLGIGEVFRKSSSQPHIPLLEEASLSSQPPDPYCLRAVGHSLGGMSLLMHCTAREPALSHVHRLILLTPAGFHVKKPRIAVPISWALPLATRLLRFIYPKFAFPIFIPTSLFRGLIFKLFRWVAPG